MAHQNSLTSLLDREGFIARLEQALRRSRDHPRSKFIVLMMDIDGFRGVNNALGYEQGDLLLAGLASRLRDGLGEGAIIARFSGAQFAVLADAEHSRISALVGATEACLAEPFLLKDLWVGVTACCGVTVGEASSQLPADLLREAELALHEAQTAGPGITRVFDESMRAGILKRLRLQSDLRRAVLEEQFEVHYQELRSAVGSGLEGFEALLRWRHPTRGLLLPERFLQVADETGVMLPIGWWVLERACHDTARLQKEFRRGFNINVNLARDQLAHDELVSRVNQALDASGLKPHTLYLEITESSLPEEEQDSDLWSRLRALRAIGVRLALDDFGVGHSSLSRLGRLPLDVVKIDRRFVHELRRGDTALFRSVVQLGQALGLEIVAEGVETEAQLLRAQQFGCDTVQGHLFTAPVSIDTVTERLRSDRHPEPPQDADAAASSS